MKFAWSMVIVSALAGCPAFAGDAIVGRQSTASIRERVLELVNQARAQGRRCGGEQYPAAPPLAASRNLRTAAQQHAEDMSRRDYFDHRGKNGSRPKDRVKRAGYEPRLTGENIAFAPESAEEVVAGWLASSSHCANIMDSRFVDTGVAVAVGRKRGHIYWVQVFAQPAASR
jgi:uncharacterized protein YkwD